MAIIVIIILTVKIAIMAIITITIIIHHKTNPFYAVSNAERVMPCTAVVLWTAVAAAGPLQTFASPDKGFGFRRLLGLYIGIMEKKMETTIL